MRLTTVSRLALGLGQVGAVLAASALPAQIYLYPALPSAEPVSLSASEANAVLSHRLGISQYESLPKTLSAGSKKGQIVFGGNNAALGEQEREDRMRIVMVVYGGDGRDIVPPALRTIPPMTIWGAPPPSSWDALVSVYIGRVVHALDIAISAVFGPDDFVTNHGGEDLAEWASEWESRVADWVHWGAEKLHIATAMEPQEQYSKWLTEAGFSNPSTQPLIQELQALDNFVESLSSTSQRPRLATLRFHGLVDVEKRYTRSSRQYRGAAMLLATMLSAATNATLLAEPDSTLALIAVPIAPSRSLGRQTPGSLLAPFRTSGRSFAKSAQLDRRGQVFGEERAAAPSAMPIISSSRKCYDGADACTEATASCNGHGECVQGQKTTGGTCYVCKCSDTEDDDTGKTTAWSGEMCEKQDVSSDFVLLAGSTIGLLILFAASVGVLYDVGSQDLPQQLASVHGGQKKHD